MKVDIFLSAVYYFLYELTWFLTMSDYSITNHMTSHDFYGTPDWISKNFSILKVITCLLWFLEWQRAIVMGRFGHEQFLFLFSFSFIFWLYRDFVFFFFSFLFFLDNEEACDIAVTWRVTWCDVIRPRMWWKDLEDDIRAHVYNMVALRRT